MEPLSAKSLLSSSVAYACVYPLSSFNARIVLEKDWNDNRKYSLSAYFSALKTSYKTEGLWNGLYKALPAHLFHRALVGICSLSAHCVIKRRKGDLAVANQRTEEEEVSERRLLYLSKYICEILCYPALTFATRCLLVSPSITAIKEWNRVDGLSLWYHGLAPYLIQLGLDDIGRLFIDRKLSHLEPIDREMMSSSCMCLITLLTTPICNISIARRCHSYLPTLVAPKSLKEQFDCNPWGAILLQSAVFAFFIGLNYYIIHLDDGDVIERR